MYSLIAHEFDKTRYKIWPVVRRFLEEKGGEGFSVYEFGCGNGKNLLYAKELGMIVSGSDVCEELVIVCQEKGLCEVSVFDLCSKDIVCGSYDMVLCIAVLHHLKTHEERLEACLRCIQTCKVGGSVLLTVWSHETHDAKRPKKFTVGDNIVPWKKKDGSYVDRFYYIYTHDEIINFMELVVASSNNSIKYSIEWEEQNWCIHISLLR
jgi:2-polyprenyl-3-methyl-5-hydroxy-6-metoxy-1,4-benzoquinol methylase